MDLSVQNNIWQTSRGGIAIARPREFDTQSALTGAMEVFWDHGYADASLPELLDGMGITRGSLYKAFTDKKTLFLTILETYETVAVGPVLTLLSDPEIPDGLARIEKLLGAVVVRVKRGERRGCLLCTAAAGPASEDAEIAEAVAQGLAKMREGFDAALAASPTHGDWQEAARHALSDALTTQYTGLRILERSQARAETLERSVQAMLHLLRAPSSVG